jgi:flagellar protein FliL
MRSPAATAAPPARRAPTPATPPPAKKRSPLLVLIAVAVILAVVTGATVWTTRADAGEETSTTEEPPPEPQEGAIVEVADMTANVGGEGMHYAKMAFAVVLEDGVDADEVSERFALLRDAALDELGASSAEGLRSPDGVDDLRDRLTARAGQLYPDGEVMRVVLTELIVQ